MKTQRVERKASRQNNVILLLAAFLLLNPFLLFIITNSITASLVCPFGAASLLLYFHNSSKLKPLTIYLFNILFVLAIFISGEAVFNNNFRDYIIDNLYTTKSKYYFNHPYLDKVFQDKEFTVNYKTNKQGFRIGFEDDPETVVSEIDWLFLGDSYTQGAQVQFEDLYTSILSDSFPDKIILNAGISGFGLPDEYNYYISEGRQLKPKKVFLQICNFNDFMNVEERTSGFSDYLMQYSNFARYLLYGFKYANPAELPLGRWTEPFYPDKESNINYNIFYQESSPSKEKDIAKFKYYLSKIKEEVNKDGAELIVLQIPTKEQIYYKFFEEVVNSFKIDVAKLDMNAPNKLLEKECQNLGIKLIDLRSSFSSSEHEVFYQYDEHLTSYGHSALANAIVNYFSNTASTSKKITYLSKSNAGDRYPNFVTDTTLLSFQSMRDGNMELFLSDNSLNQVSRLTFNNIDELHPWVIPGINKIIFTEESQDRSMSKVAIMNLDGSQREYITKENNIFGAIPSPNMQESKVAYAEWQVQMDGSFSHSYIVVADLEKGTKRVVSPTNQESWRPIFSRDGNSVYFISRDNKSANDIFVYDLLSNKLTNLTNTTYDEWDPAISPDGKSLIYAGKKDGNWDLFILDLDTLKKRQITKTKGNEWDPCFAPNGKEIYFAGTFGLKNGIYKMAL